MPTAKCKISSRSTGLEIRFALKEALEEKGYERITLVGLSNLLDIYFFIDKAPALPKPWVIPAQSVVNFCPKEVVYASRI